MRAPASAERRRLRVVALVLAAAPVVVTVDPGIAAPPPAVAARDTSPAAPTGASPRAAGVRVPGTWMRLGQTREQMLSRAQFAEAPGPSGGGVVTRQGPATWFGLPSEATLRFRDERLERAEFVVEEVAPYWVDYVQDQLRLAGYAVACEQDRPGLRLCDWRGATHVRLELRVNRLTARISAAGSAPEPRGAGPRSAKAAGRDTVPVFPHVFVLGRPLPEGVRTGPVLADSTALVAPDYPPAARAAGVQGRVWVRAMVDTSGAVEKTEVVRGIAELDSAAVAVVRRCRFRPYPPQGGRVRFRVEIPVTFMAREP